MSVGTAAPARPDGRLAGWTPVLVGVLGFALTRVLTLLVAWQQGGERTLAALSRADGTWYLRIVADGYDDSLAPAAADGAARLPDLAFFPLFPQLVRLVSLTGLSPAVSALVVSGVAGLVCAWGLVRLGEQLGSARVGVVLAVLWGVQPAAVALSMVLSEATFTAFAVWALVHLLRGHLLPAALLAVAAGLTRPTGVAVVLAVWWVAVPLAVQRTSTRRLEAATAVVVAPLGLAAFLVFVAARIGTWDGYWQVQRVWRTGVDWGATLATTVRERLFDTAVVPYAVVAWLVVVGVVLLVALLWSRPPGAVVVYTLAALTLITVQAGYVHSRQRFLLVVFPLLLPLARLLARPPAWVTVLVLVAAASLSAWYGAWLLYSWRYSI